MAAKAAVVAGAESAAADPLEMYHPALDAHCRALTAGQAAVFAESGWVPAHEVAADGGVTNPGDEPANKEA